MCVYIYIYKWTVFSNWPRLPKASPGCQVQETPSSSSISAASSSLWKTTRRTQWRQEIKALPIGHPLFKMIKSGGFNR